MLTTESTPKIWCAMKPQNFAQQAGLEQAHNI